jgi:hypothetical protein
MLKTIIFALALATIFTSCENDSTSQNEIALSDFILENYYEDAKQLYYNEIWTDSSHIRFNNPELDTTEIREVLKIIQAVYNLNSAERDTVFDVYKIHGYYCYSFNSIYLQVNTELPAVQNLANGVIPTGDKEFDNLLSAYALDSVELFYGYSQLNWLVVFTKKEFNLIPVVKQFEMLDAVLFAEFSSGCIGSGNTIFLKRNGNELKDMNN